MDPVRFRPLTHFARGQSAGSLLGLPRTKHRHHRRLPPGHAPTLHRRLAKVLPGLRQQLPARAPFETVDRGIDEHDERWGAQ